MEHPDDRILTIHRGQMPVSPDGRWAWDGNQWLPVQPPPPPAPPGPPGDPATAQGSAVPVGMPVAGTPSVASVAPPSAVFPPPSPPSAVTVVEPGADLAETGIGSPDDFLKRSANKPKEGLPRLLYTVTGGRVNLGPSKAELRRRDLERRIRTSPTARPIVTAVVSPKGGVGKTTISLLLSALLGRFRTDNIIVVETNPHAGTFAERLNLGHSQSIYDLLQFLNDVPSEDAVTLNQLENFVNSVPENDIKVLTSPLDARIRAALGQDDFKRVYRVLFRSYPFITLDTGTDILNPSSSYTLAEAADQVVVVVKRSDGAKHGVHAVNLLLQKHSRQWVKERVVVVINEIRADGLLDLDAVERTFAPYVRSVVRLHWDRHLDAAGRLDLDAINPVTLSELDQLTAVVGDGFAMGMSPDGDRTLRV